MWFLNIIISYLGNIRDWFLSAYNEVKGWVWPFNNLATPLYYLYYAFSYVTLYFGYFNDWVATANTKLSQILDINQIIVYLKTWLDYATYAWQWVGNAISNVTSIITSWWSSAQETVLAWIEQAKQWTLAQIQNLAAAMVEVQAWWNSFKSNLPTLSEIIAWFQSWWPNILSMLGSWWIERLLDVEALFNSWFLELSPLWEGWQEIREEVFEFFSDPLEWLWARFTDWFLGPEG